MDTGKERGFFICKDEKGNLFPSRKTCEGTECEVTLKDPRGACPIGIQGDFHTHPYLATAKKYLKEQGKKIGPDIILKEEVRKTLKETHEEQGVIGISLVAPSYKDALRSILVSCISTNIDGTACIGSDLEDDKVECWTPKKDIKLTDCSRAEEELKKLKEEKLSPKKWVIPLFERETIDLKKEY